MASSASSLSLSPTHLPSSPHDPPRLVAHLIAAKRSLSATAHVERANTLVSTARGNIEDIAALSARNAFLQRYVQRELRLLQHLRRRLDAVLEKGTTDFKAVLRTLDASDARVKQTLHLLKTTLVEPSFQPRQPDVKADPDQDANSANQTTTLDDEASPVKQKCLYDFVSEQGVDDLAQVFRQCIDATNDATDLFTSTNEAFDAELQAITDKTVTSASAPPDDDGLSSETTAVLFRSLESNATETASLLQSLVRHYDLCVTALKHTEGGGEAAAQAQAQVDLPGGLAELETAQERDGPHTPITEDEHNEMVAVLEKDALEVDDVVQEIRDRAAEMEGQLAVLSSRVAALKSEHASLNAAVGLLDALGRKLPVYIEASATFLDRWAEQKTKIERNMDELEALRDFYDGFLGAYDGLILEIARRKVVQTKMEKVIQEAMAKVGKLYDDDMQDREAFKVEQGEYLPADLWPGLVDPPVKFEVQRADQAANDLPEVSKEAVQRAMQRHGKKL